ncbi:lactococcin 972 family bacteriocin [Clostridium taeniosporum]|uniref:Bacteriocin n=1 Tax=Clostridium taeniosporum TaxID=394958 RepID=A0A1D7XNY3_9CLOT|nr:lactococcin 972 family bacteriocin [Clostridium taeniosporum]AOR25026.1 hypothetical protein BGI42_14865 [Clostridium taeniosporum]
MNNKLKKGIVSLLAVGAILAPTTSTVFASEANSGNGGYEVISDKTQTGVKSSEKSGGYWIRGKKNGEVISKYKHYTEQGYASVINGEGDTDDGGWQPAGEWSPASAEWTFWGTNKSFYNHKA